MAIAYMAKFQSSFFPLTNSGLKVSSVAYVSPSLTRRNITIVSFSGREKHLCFSTRKDSMLCLRGRRLKVHRLEATRRSEHAEKKEDDSVEMKEEDSNELMDEEEREEWRNKIREVIDQYPETDEVIDQDEKRRRMQKLLTDYPLVVEEEDPNWPEDADGWGFNLSQFFNKVTIKNVKKDDDEDYDSDKEIVWQDDDYIRPIKDITTADWEETVFKDISPLIILVHNRYRRPKENQRCRDELEEAVNIIWNCRLPSPRCIAVDAVVECDLVSALRVSNFPELIFTKAGKILYREKGIRTADELSKIMAFFYYGAAKPPFFTHDEKNEVIPSAPARSRTP